MDKNNYRLQRSECVNNLITRYRLHMSKTVKGKDITVDDIVVKC